MTNHRRKNVRRARWWRHGVVAVALAGPGAGMLGGTMAEAATDHQPRAHAPVTANVRTSPAMGVARQSLTEVAELHDLAVSAGKRHTAATIPVLAQGVEASFRSELETVEGLHPAASSAIGSLEKSLTGYLALATTLVNATNSSAKPVSTSYVTHLRTADGKWRKALNELGKEGHENLLAGMPPLLYPKKRPA